MFLVFDALRQVESIECPVASNFEFLLKPFREKWWKLIMEMQTTAEDFLT